MLLGLSDVWIFLAYLSCILVTAICIIYGLVNWNKGAEKESKQIEEELEWEAKDEEKV